jgi:hypothetical protein
MASAVSRWVQVLAWGLIPAWGGGCSGSDDSPAVPAGGTVEGDYTISVTNRENGCDFDDWTTGDSVSRISLELSEDDGEATGVVRGQWSGLALRVWLGPEGNVLEGTAVGGQVDLTRYGTTALNQGDCSYTLTATVTAQVNGDVIEGSIRYTAATNDNPDCAELEGCVSRQAFNGTRPPS